MARVKAISDGPIVFFSGGRHVVLPLSDIYFATDSANTDSYTSDGMTKWLKYLVAQKRLSRSSTPAPGDAMVLTAADAGSNGNNIVVTIAANGATSVDITVTET